MLMHENPLCVATITPSGNTVVERTTIAMLRDMPSVAPLFSRLPVHGSTDLFPDSYDTESMLAAARLLSHAKPAAILWNGSKGGAIGLDHDVALAARITAETGIAADTSGLMLRRLMAAQGHRRIGLVTPYAAAYQQRLVAAFAREGWEVLAESHLGLTDNLSYASVPFARIAEQAREVARARPDVLLAWCTNYAAAPVAADVEAETALPFWDATALGVLAALRAAGVAERPGAAWGSLMGVA
jgi:maleate isomerase